MPTATSHYKTEIVFDFTWKQVVQAYWNRYPNPSSTHVLTEDTICREVRDGKLYSRRLLSKTNPVPKWGKRFYNNTPVKIIEDSILDPNKKTLITFTRNIGFKKIMKVDEIVEYSEQKDGRTLAVRRAYITSQVFGFSRAIRAFGIERFKTNCSKAANGFTFVLCNMFPNQMTSAKNQISPLYVEPTASIKPDHHASATEGFKKTYRNIYEYFKCQGSKVGQVFSVRN